MSKDAFYRIQTIRFLAVMVLVAVIVMRLFIWAVVPSSSMEPTLKIGSFCLTRRTENVDHGDIVCFLPYDEPPKHSGALYMLDLKLNNKVLYVKRVIGLPGDKIEIRDGRLYRNDELIAEDYLKEQCINRDFGPVVVEEGHLFFMGDNRNNSKDSRVFGQIPREQVAGRVFLHITPLDFSD